MLFHKLFPHLRSLHLETVSLDAGTVTFTVAIKRPYARCPLCQQRSTRKHSRYRRRVADLPLGGRSVMLDIQVRRFYCVAPACPRRLFAERLPELVAPRARRSHGLRRALEEIAFAAGGEGGARLAHTLGMPTSPDTLLRLIRAAPVPEPGQPTVIGIDDWAYKRGLRYGTIICDLERHRPADLLPDRSADSVAAWLEARPSVEVAARDRGGLYADGIARGAPQAVQVADRWHLVDNLADALEKFLLHKGASLKAAAAALVAAAREPGEARGPVDEMYRGKPRIARPQRGLQRAEEESERRLAPRRAQYEAVCALQGKGATIMDIARMVGVTRRTVYRYLNDGPPQRRRPTAHQSRRVLDPWEPYLLARWDEGCHTATVLWAEIRAQGFAHSVSNVERFCAQLRREGPPPRTLARAASPFASIRGPSARRVASLMVQRPERRTAEQVAYLEHLRQADASIAAVDALTQDFLRMVRERQGERLDNWIETAAGGESAEVRRFALGLRDDYEAVHAGLTLAHSNGQTEGFINKLKLTKRSMYGRGKADLLRQRLLRAA
ncbi:MAG TPA: ISL3 family transposase [Chloroflexota bacterium]|nr:ISL3 family transposase [Chloroflexota bacterium]